MVRFFGEFKRTETFLNVFRYEKETSTASDNVFIINSQFINYIINYNTFKYVLRDSFEETI